MSRDSLAAIASADTPEALQSLRTQLLGKNGEVTQQLRGLGALPPEERKARGAEINLLKQALEEAFARRETELEGSALKAQLAAEALDVTLPGLELPAGGLHVITRVLYELEDIFAGMGYSVIEGREVEDETHNFDALNMPSWHPARDLQDTFWLEDGFFNGSPTDRAKSDPQDAPRLALRTHTSNMQVRYMEAHEPPLKIVVPGKVYRYEATDATHESMFHQFEGLVVGKRVTMADLKGAVAEMARAMFGAGARVRFQPSYYPFTEPGADFSIWWDQEQRWLELGGSGMVHPNVFRAVDDLREARGKTRVYEGMTGFAFGLGPNRIAMLRYGIPDIRYFYANDPRVLEQFRGNLERGELGQDVSLPHDTVRETL